MSAMGNASSGHGLNRVIELGIQSALNNFGATKASCRPLTWDLFSGSPIELLGSASEYGEADTADVVRAWARLLNLSRTEPPEAGGTIQFDGAVDGIRMCVFGITDQAFFNIAAEEG